jgi:small subunit ribosomal protein S2
VIDAHKEGIALKEARRLGIPIVAVTDTNADPDLVDYVIPGNDDSIKALQLFISTAADACISGRMRSKDRSADGDKSKSVETGSFYDDQGRPVAVEKARRFGDEETN